MNVPFSISEFLITQPNVVEVDVCDKLWKYHIIPMTPVRNELNLAIWASLRSGYRPEWYENTKGRNGDSEHCFKEKGAVDWTCTNIHVNEIKYKFLELIIKHTKYTRIAIYKGFIHCDHKPTKSGRREIYTSNSRSQWVFERYAD